METSRKIKRSELWNKIYDKVIQLPRANVEGDSVDHPSLASTLEELFKSEFSELYKRHRICDELLEIKLTPSLREEFDNIAKNQPVFAGNLQSHQGAKELIDMGLVMRYEGDYVLTNKGDDLKQKLEKLFEIIYDEKFLELFRNFIRMHHLTSNWEDYLKENNLY